MTALMSSLSWDASKPLGAMEPVSVPAPAAETDAESGAAAARDERPRPTALARLPSLGHRPPEIGGYGKNPVADGLRRHMKEILAAKASMYDEVVVLTGLQLGSETLGAEAALEAGVGFVAVLAFPDPSARWPKAAQKHFDDLIDQAADVVVLDTEVPGTGIQVAKSFGRRDRWLQDQRVRSHRGLGWRDQRRGEAAPGVRESAWRRRLAPGAVTRPGQPTVQVDSDSFESLECLLDGRKRLLWVTHQFEGLRGESGRPVEGLGDHGAPVDFFEFVTPPVLSEVGPGNKSVFFELDDGAAHVVGQDKFHLHAELRAHLQRLG